MTMKAKKTGIAIGIAFAAALVTVLIFVIVIGLKKEQGEVFAEKINSAGEETTVKRKSMYEMTAEETYQTLLDNGFVLPDSWKHSDKEYIIEKAKEAVDYIIENDGYQPLGVSFTELIRFYARIQKVVVEYEGIEDPFPDYDFEENLPEWGGD